MNTTRVLLYGGALGGPAFVLTLLVLGANRADYDPVLHPISSLALGPGGWVQAANFVIAGLSSLALAAGLWRQRGSKRTGAVLTGLWGVGFLGTAVFTTDAVSGYPAGTPAIPDGTPSGTLHNLFALVGALALVALCVVFARGGRTWTTYSLTTAALFVVALGLAGAGLAQADGLVDVAGLLDRVAVVIAWAWMTALAIRALRQTRDQRRGENRNSNAEIRRS
ncbi:DUF998 domain-containing protein [Dactylosporangium sp. NPDC005572]|uniref:DUF998 domain-containing protein n=1 Tax=Dactylosporangium sp. NPDC005572 TaxID=3156889 RepID=UPI0033BDB7BD